MRGFLCMLLVATCLGFSERFETFYGSIEVEEPVLIDLIHSAPMQRLKSIHQYGIAYYTTHREEYNRFDHSMGVFVLLRKNKASLEEQIAGLLHDVSHTAFSHVGDWLFGREYQEEDYQTLTQKRFLKESGLETILNHYGYTVDQVLVKNQNFAMLDLSLPNLSADRIDYNIQGAYFQNYLTKEEALELAENLSYIEGKWISSRQDLARKIGDYSLFMTRDCWSGPINYMMSRWFADALKRGIEIGMLTWDDIHFGIDDLIWEKLLTSNDPLIVNKMGLVQRAGVLCELTQPELADFRIPFRCRGIDPWIEKEGNIYRLSALDEQYGNALEALQKQSHIGWSIRILEMPPR